MKKQEKEEPITVGTYDVSSMSLAEKIAAITGEIETIEKKRHPGQTVQFKYRSIDDVQNAINPMLSQFQVTLQSEVLRCDLTMREFEKGGSKKVVYTAVVHLRLIFSDKSREKEIWEEVAMSEDYADKAVTQAMSMCYKYALTRKFAIPTEDIPDGDARQPDYRDNDHDADRSGPRPTKWLNEDTPEWEEHIVAPINSGMDPVKVLANAKAKFKTNKRQDDAILKLLPVKAEAKEQKSTEPVKQPEAAAPTGSKKPMLTAKDKTDWERMAADYEQMDTPPGDRFKKGAVNPNMRIYNNNVVALKTRKVQLESIKSIYDLDETVLKHYQGL